MRQIHKPFNKKLKLMPLINLHNISTFFISVYAVEEGSFNLEITGTPILSVELRCEKACLESHMAVSLVDVKKFVRESLDF